MRRWNVRQKRSVRWGTWGLLMFFTALLLAQSPVNAVQCASALCYDVPGSFVNYCYNQYGPYGRDGYGSCMRYYWGTIFQCCCDVGTSGCCDYNCQYMNCSPSDQYGACPRYKYWGGGYKYSGGYFCSGGYCYYDIYG